MTGSVTDEKRVPEKFGVRPDQIIDFLALMGDAVDNVKGVEKCGPKTAAKWLAEYGTLETVIANAEKFTGKIGENLRTALPILPLNRTLVTIKTDVPLEQDYTQLLQLPPHQDDLSALYSRFGFKQALKELQGAAASPSSAPKAASSTESDAPPVLLPEAKPGEYTAVLDWAAFDAMLATLNAAELVCFDTETDSLDPMQANLVGLSFAVEPGAAWYIPLAHDYPGAPSQLPMADALQRLTPLLTDAGKGKCAQNGKYDLHVLNRCGIAVQGLREDTLLASFVLNAGRARHDMDSMALNYLGYQTIAYSDVAGKGAKQIPFSQVAIDDATRYAAEDADITLRLQQHFAAQLQQTPTLEALYRNMEIPLQQVLCDIEENGVLVDTALLRRQSADLSARMLQVQNAAYEIAGRHFNLDSPKQLGTLLFDELGLEAKLKTPTGAPSTNEEALEAIADEHELPRLILDYRGMAKLRSTYTDKLPQMVNPRTGRVHTSYRMAGAATALWAQEAFAADIEHARYMTLHDGVAMMAMQYGHNGLESIWPLIETALFAPQQSVWLDAPPEPLVYLKHGTAHIALLDCHAWMQLQSGLEAKNGEQLETLFQMFQMRQRQIAALLEAHGLSVEFDFCADAESARDTLQR